MTSHIGTRNYRAPEVILLQKNYSYEVDNWSVGWIIAEILQLTWFETPHEFLIKSTILFPGECCYPLSPKKKSDSVNKGYPYNKNDQLMCILRVLGSRDHPGDTEFINGEKLKKYLASLPKFEGCLKTFFPHVTDEDSLELLQGLLEFNPSKRHTIEQCLNHPFVSELKKQDVTDKAYDYESKIELKFENFWHKNISKKELRELFKEEFELYLSTKC